VPHPRLILLTAICFTVIWPAGSAAAVPLPVPQIQVSGSGKPVDAAPHVAPDGNQIVTYTTQTGNTVVLSERGSQGGQFSEPAVLSTTTNPEPPSISFTGDGGIYAIWGISSSGMPAEQSFRLPGGAFSPSQPAVGCGRFVDSAAGPDGGIAVACSHRLATNPPDTISFGTSPTLGPVTVNEDLVPAAYENFFQPQITWGSDGTIAIVSRGRKTITDPPPANETMRIRVSIRGPVNTSADVAEATWPDEVHATPPLVLEDGTVAVGLSGSAGSRVLIRPPGLLSTFSTHPLLGEGIGGIGLDGDQNLHVLSGNPEASPRQYWAYSKTPTADFGTAVPVPLAGAGDPYIPFDTFQVAPDGTEYVLIRADDGIYATYRQPGLDFATPVKIGNSAFGNPASAVTPEGDLLVAWVHEVGPDDRTVELGGLDRTPPAVTVNSFPTRVEAGSLVTVAATASDAMGIASSVWDFGEDQRVDAAAVNHTFTRPGRHDVTFTATDRAGQKTVEKRTVIVPGEPTGPGGMNLKLRTAKRMKFQTLKKRGVRIAARAKPKMRLRVVLGTSKRNARLRPLATKKVKRLRNRHVLRVKPRRARLGKRRKLRLYVQVTGITVSGQRVTKSRTVRVRR
jgi:PKD repeat protein